MAHTTSDAFPLPAAAENQRKQNEVLAEVERALLSELDSTRFLRLLVESASRQVRRAHRCLAGRRGRRAGGAHHVGPRHLPRRPHGVRRRHGGPLRRHALRLARAELSAVGARGPALRRRRAAPRDGAAPHDGRSAPGRAHDEPHGRGRGALRRERSPQPGAPRRPCRARVAQLHAVRGSRQAPAAGGSPRRGGARDGGRAGSRAAAAAHRPARGQSLQRGSGGLSAARLRPRAGRAGHQGGGLGAHTARHRRQRAMRGQPTGRPGEQLSRTARGHSRDGRGRRDCISSSSPCSSTTSCSV